jgi:hypothetical protein
MELLKYYTNSGSPWYKYEDEQLKREFFIDKINIIQIGNLHKRTPGGIVARLKHLGLIQKKAVIKEYEEYRMSNLYKEVREKCGKQPLIVSEEVKQEQLTSSDYTQSKKILLTKFKGYIYCMSNASMPGILKIGMTNRTPEDRLKDANRHDTFKPPTPYQLVFAKEVWNPKKKEGIIHTLLARYTDRINPQREFFRVSSDEVYQFFQLVDGPWWKNDSSETILNPSNNSTADTCTRMPCHM